MYTTTVFLEYLIAIFAAQMEITVIILLLIKGKKCQSEKTISIMWFSFAILVICLVNFSLYYSDRMLNIISVNSWFRSIDYLCHGVQYVLWFVVIKALSNKNNNHIFIIDIVVSTLYCIIGIVVAGFFMDEYYHVSSILGRFLVTCWGVLFVGIAIMLIINIINFMRDIHTKLQRLYVGITSLIIIIGGTIYTVSMNALYTSEYNSGWQSESTDFTGIYILIISLLSFLFVFKEDFSPLFFRSPDLKESDNPILVTAALHQLTVRECEVLTLLYKGMHNPEIATALNISPNTVKKHVQNIYEKTGVNSRMEIVYLINLKNNENNTNG